MRSYWKCETQNEAVRTRGNAGAAELSPADSGVMPLCGPSELQHHAQGQGSGLVKLTVWPNVVLLQGTPLGATKQMGVLPAPQALRCCLVARPHGVLGLWTDGTQKPQKPRPRGPHGPRVTRVAARATQATPTACHTARRFLKRLTSRPQTGATSTNASCVDRSGRRGLWALKGKTSWLYHGLT